MTSSSARHSAALLALLSTTFGGCIIERGTLTGDGEDAFSTVDAFSPIDAARDAWIAEDVPRDVQGVPDDVPGDTSSDVGTDARIVPPGDLIAHWEFESSATFLTDSTGNNHTLTILGSVAMGARSHSNELEFRGSPGLSTPNAADLDEVTAVSFWALPTPAPEVNVAYPILSSAGRLSVRYDATEASEWRYRCTVGTTTVASSRALADWAHIACVVRGATLEIYVNGAMAASSSTSPPAGSDASYFLGAAEDGTSSPFVANGRMDDVRLWRVAPSGDQIGSLAMTRP